jgi:hypothetical protein
MWFPVNGARIHGAQSLRWHGFGFGSGAESERRNVRWPHDSEVSKRGDVSCLEALCDRDDRGIHSSKTEICIPLDQLRSPFEVGCNHVLDLESPRDEAAEKGTLDLRLSALGKQIAHLGNHEIWDD